MEERNKKPCTSLGLFPYCCCCLSSSFHHSNYKINSSQLHRSFTISKWSQSLLMPCVLLALCAHRSPRANPPKLLKFISIFTICIQFPYCHFIQILPLFFFLFILLSQPYSWSANIGLLPLGRSIQTRFLLWRWITETSIPWIDRENLDAIHHWCDIAWRFGKFKYLFFLLSNSDNWYIYFTLNTLNGDSHIAHIENIHFWSSFISICYRVYFVLTSPIQLSDTVWSDLLD